MKWALWGLVIVIGALLLNALMIRLLKGGPQTDKAD